MNHIVFCLDDNYASLLGVAINSLLKNSSAKFCFWIMHNNLSIDNQNKIQKIAAKSKSMIFFIPVDEKTELLEFKKPKIWANKVCYYRLLAPLLVPQYAKAQNISIDKILFMDCDILVLRDIAPIFDIDLKDKTLAAVVSPLHEEERAHIPELNISPDHKFFYAGLMLIDCNKWKNRKIYEQAVKIDIEHPEGLKWADMDMLNIIFQNDYISLPPKYSIWPGLNFKPYLYEFDNVMDGYNGIATVEDVKEAFLKPVVYQLAGGAKPWRECATFETVRLWFKYSMFTPYMSDGIKYLLAAAKKYFVNGKMK